MPNQARETLFYILRSRHNSDYYAVHSILTDRLVLDKQSTEDVKGFLRVNNPNHPFLTGSNVQTQDALQTYHLYYNGLENPVTLYNLPPDYGYTSNHNQYAIRSYSNNIIPNDNDVDTSSLSESASDSDSDSDYDSDLDSYGDSNNIPYIIGTVDYSKD